MPNDIPVTTHQIHLAARPGGAPLAGEHFRFVEIPTPSPGPGEVLVRNEYLGVAAVHRELIDGDTELPMPSYEVGAPIWGYGVGTVVAAGPDAAGGAAVGDLVVHPTLWADYAISTNVQVVDRDGPRALPDPSYYLSNGPTALLGVRDIAGVGEGDVVLVSGAAGGVGSLSGQIAKRLGAARVIGTAGSAAKCAWLTDELGFDVALDYHGDDLVDRLHKAAPDGIDVFVDLVGGAQFEAAVQVAAKHARFALGGALATQQGGADWPRFDIQTAMVRNLTIRPFTLAEHLHLIGEWPGLFARWLGEGMVFPHTVVEGGVEAVPQTLIDLVDGRFTGNVSVHLS